MIAVYFETDAKHKYSLWEKCWDILMLMQVVLNIYRCALIKEEYPVFFILCDPVAYLLSRSICALLSFPPSQFYMSSYSTTTSSNTSSTSIQRILGSVSHGGKTAEAWSLTYTFM
jgi:hypothetical protein